MARAASPPLPAIESSTDRANDRSGRRRAKLADVAAAAGLSPTQVSRALAGYGDVAQATRDRVRLLARELGYYPSHRARALAYGAHGREATLRCAVVTVGVSSSSFHRSSYAPVLPGIMARAARDGMETYLAPLSPRDPAAELARFVAEDRADGAVLLTFADLRPEHVAPLNEAGVPFVLVNRHFEHLGGPVVNTVALDWRGATADAVERLFALGHRRMAALFHGRHTSTLHDHVVGWEAARARRGLSEAEAPIVPYSRSGIDDAEAGYETMRDMLTAGPLAGGRPGTHGARSRPTAVVTFNDFCAHGVLRAAREAGVRVPDDLSVISFDNMIAPYVEPPLCSYDPDFHRAGEEAVQMLGRLLRGEVEGPQRVTIPQTFVCRETCAPPG